MIIYGLHSVLNFLKERPDLVKKIYLSKKFDYEILKSAKIENIDRKDLTKLTQTTDHQGIACEIKYFPYVSSLHEIKNLKTILILDHIEDPRNFGAILRNAAAFNIDLIVIPKDRACDVTPTVIKASAGTAIYLNIAKVTNINNFIREIKNDYFRVYGFEVDGDKLLSQTFFYEKTAFVLGSEGKGISRLTKTLCDEIISIDFNPKAGSLNVSSASAIVLYKLYVDINKFA